MKISIILCTYNRLQQLIRGFYTLRIQNPPCLVEFVLVDDGSTDGTKEWAKTIELQVDKPYDFKYIYLDHPEPRISCIPRNIGIKQATGDIIIFTEPEALHVSNTIERLLIQMERHPENTILASQVWTMQKKIYESLREEYFADPQKILDHPYAMMTDNKHPNNTNAIDSDWAITGERHCNAGVLFATRKEWLEKIRGFDESFEGHGFDDFDLFNRLALIGHGIIKCSEIVVIHQYHDKSFYRYNIYESAERNGRISEKNIKNGIYQVNAERWGQSE